MPRLTDLSSTQDRPSGLGRKGERVANTPIRTLPPSLGGRTVGDQSARRFSENPQISQRCEKPSSPRSASGLQNSGSNTTVDISVSIIPLWRGKPNFEVKSLCMLATARTLISSMPITPFPLGQYSAIVYNRAIRLRRQSGVFMV